MTDINARCPTIAPTHLSQAKHQTHSSKSLHCCFPCVKNNKKNKGQNFTMNKNEMGVPMDASKVLSHWHNERKR